MSTLILVSVWVARLVLGYVLLASAVDKIRHRRKFLAAVMRYELLPLAGSVWVSYVLPWTELLLGFWIVAAVGTQDAALATGALLLFFAALSAFKWLTGARDLPCGCGGTHQRSTIGPGHILSNLLLVGLATWILAFGGDLPLWDRVARLLTEATQEEGFGLALLALVSSAALSAVLFGTLHNRLRKGAW